MPTVSDRLTCAEGDDAHRWRWVQVQLPGCGQQPCDGAIAACCHQPQVPARQRALRLSEQTSQITGAGAD